MVLLPSKLVETYEDGGQQPNAESGSLLANPHGNKRRSCFAFCRTGSLAIGLHYPPTTNDQTMDPCHIVPSGTF